MEINRIDVVFRQLASASKTAFMPFVTAGDPDLDFTSELLRRLNDAHCDLVEVGFPYSDPIADGPVIQESYARALKSHLAVNQIFQMVKATAPRLKMPMVAMVSYAIIYRHGVQTFLDHAIDAGFYGAIVPDLPSDESTDFAAHCRGRDFKLIQLIAPTTSDERALKIASAATGFIYYVSLAGITGERDRLPDQLQQRLAWLNSQTDKPICVGFGISRPEHVRLLADQADGVIVGSAIIRRLAEIPSRGRRETLDDITSFVRQMRAALD
jgi:tryptophan synthase alpha chain